MIWHGDPRTTSQTRKEYAEEVLRQSNWSSDRTSNEVLGSSLRGNHLWTAQRQTNHHSGKVITYIGLDILTKERGGIWWHKTLLEYSGPVYHTCPKRLLKLAPYCPEQDTLGSAKRWRDSILTPTKGDNQ